MPFNMNTFNKLWRVVTPEEARQKMAEAIIKKNNKKQLIVLHSKFGCNT